LVAVAVGAVFGCVVADGVDGVDGVDGGFPVAGVAVVPLLRCCRCRSQRRLPRCDAVAFIVVGCEATSGKEVAYDGFGVDLFVGNIVRRSDL
jgi:hypothetical protein